MPRRRKVVVVCGIASMHVVVSIVGVLCVVGWRTVTLSRDDLVCGTFITPQRLLNVHESSERYVRIGTRTFRHVRSPIPPYALVVPDRGWYVLVVEGQPSGPRLVVADRTGAVLCDRELEDTWLGWNFNSTKWSSQETIESASAHEFIIKSVVGGSVIRIRVEVEKCRVERVVEPDRNP